MSELAIKLINEAYDKRSTFLDLGNCGLREIPKELLKLKDFLQHLNLGAYYSIDNSYTGSVNDLKQNYIGENERSLLLLRDLPNLTALQLYHNGLGILGAEYISQLGSLNLLNLERNAIGDNGAKYISRLSSLSFLSLCGNKIGEKGIENISRIPFLTSLVVSDNKIEEKGAEYISRLSFLTSLDLGENEIGDKGAEYISRLLSLKKLDLGRNGIGEKGAEYISRLTSLNSLNLGINEIGDYGAECISRLSSLTSLYLTQNGIGEKGAGSISRLPSIITLRLNKNNIGNQGAEYISNLHALTSLSLVHNGIGDDGAEPISRLSNLTSLDLSMNKIGDLGAEYISRLSRLTWLEIRYNHIGRQGAAHISRLPSLVYLNLANNDIEQFNTMESKFLQTLYLQANMIENLSLELIKKIPLEVDVKQNNFEGSDKIFLYGNPIKNVPPEVLDKGRIAILEYLEGELRPLNECKLIFVGDGSVGKTSLMKSLVYGKINEHEITTHGINKIAWKGITNDKGEPIKVNCWDFGGQHIQHSLHQFFFTERVVYVLVLNPRNDEKAGYWLDQVDKLGRDSQIIIVYNWKDKEDIQADFLRNFRELKKTYKYLPEPIVLSCATGEGMADFKAALKQAVLSNEGLKIKYPTTWFNIKEKLENRIPIEKHYIKYDQYETWCEEEEYNDRDQRLNLLRILDSVGSIVFFNKPVLNELQVLNPEWITTGAYAILTADITRQKKGHVNWHDLRKIFETEKEIFSDKNIRIKYEEPQFKFILQLMLDYWLCQENPLLRHEYLIPVAFGEKPDKKYDIARGRHYRLKFQSPFEMLIMHRFIAKNIVNIVSNDYWNSGIYFKHTSSATYALVDTNQYSQVIDCWIDGENIRGLWEVIRNDFREIFNMYHNFPVDEEVSYTDGDNTVFLKYDEMLRALNNGMSVIPYDIRTGLKNIDVLRVLELFESHNQNIKVMEREQIKVEVNVNNNPVITNTQTVSVPENNPLPGKTYDLHAENKEVKRWKRKAVIAGAISLLVTLLLVLIWKNKWFLSPGAWRKVDHYEVVKLSGIALGVIWNSFIVKILYDRLFDVSKEKTYREGLRK